jgi:hypothetical protein
MGYNKIVTYGNIIETFTYARDPNIPPRTQRRHSCHAGIPGASDDAGSVDEREAFEGKRKDNADRASMVFRQLVLANLTGTEYPLLLTATYRDNQTDLRQGYRDFGAFIQAMRYRFGKEWRYIAVPEFQKRGAVHFHALIWGLPTSVFEEERSTRLVAGLWKHGFVYLKMTDGNEKLSSYLTKYMAKSFVDRRLMNQKAYVCSRNLKRPQVVGHISKFSIDTYLEECGVTDPEIDNSYETRWLGTARHRIYKLSTENPPKQKLSEENIESTIPLT